MPIARQLASSSAPATSQPSIREVLKVTSARESLLTATPAVPRLGYLARRAAGPLSAALGALVSGVDLLGSGRRRPLLVSATLRV